MCLDLHTHLLTHTHTRFERTHLAQLLEHVCVLESEVSQSLSFVFNFLLCVPPGYESAPSLQRQRVTDVCRTLTHSIGMEKQSEGFLYTALKAEVAVVMQEREDGETAAKRPCLPITPLASKTP